MESPAVSRQHLASSHAVTAGSAAASGLNSSSGGGVGSFQTIGREGRIPFSATATLTTASSASVARSLPPEHGRSTTTTLTAPPPLPATVNTSATTNTTTTSGLVKSTSNTSTGGGMMSSSSSFAITERRPVDDALQGLFPATFTKAQFLEDAVRVVKNADGYCFTEKGEDEFWQAFESVEYVGEGSFGLVWKCKTVTGDVVAVKSCPVSFAYPESIDDAYSLLREVSIMVFLNKMKVPYVPPLHGSFFTMVSQALPAPVRKATEAFIATEEQAEKIKKVKQQLDKKVATVETKVTAKWHKSGRYPGSKKPSKPTGKKRGRSASPPTATSTPPTVVEMTIEDANRLIAEEVNDDPEVLKMKGKMESELAKLEALTIEATSLRGSMLSKMPKYNAIDKRAALGCDATIFLVTDLCDGDLESIDRSEAVTKRVAFCISTALASIHRLGLVHLDLKPANILYAFDRSVPPSSSSSSNHQQQHVAVKFILSDFGNCQVVGRSYSDTIQPSIGTYEYMDFETLSSRTSSRATDCFSLGATLYELMTGKRYIKGCCKGGGAPPTIDSNSAAATSSSSTAVQVSMAPLLYRPPAAKAGRGKRSASAADAHYPTPPIPGTPPCRQNDRHSPRSCYAPHFLRHKLRHDPKGLIEHLISLHLLDPSGKVAPKKNPSSSSATTVIGSIPAEVLSTKESQALASILRGGSGTTTTSTSGGGTSTTATKLANITASAAALGSQINAGMGYDLPDVAAELAQDGYTTNNNTNAADTAAASSSSPSPTKNTTTTTPAGSSNNNNSNVLVSLVTSLLQHDRSQRMTAAGCRHTLMDALAPMSKRPSPL